MTYIRELLFHNGGKLFHVRSKLGFKLFFVIQTVPAPGNIYNDPFRFEPAHSGFQIHFGKGLSSALEIIPDYLFGKWFVAFKIFSEFFGLQCFMVVTIGKYTIKCQKLQIVTIRRFAIYCLKLQIASIQSLYTFFISERIWVAAADNGDSCSSR